MHMSLYCVFTKVVALKPPPTCCYTIQFLGVFKKLRKATISFDTIVCTSVHMEHLGSQWMDFH
jgi:hypothetical protein